MVVNQKIFKTFENTRRKTTSTSYSKLWIQDANKNIRQDRTENDNIKQMYTKIIFVGANLCMNMYCLFIYV
jgi:hypothetical protein